MKAIAVRPGTPNSMHLREVDPPRVTDVEGGRGVLVEVIRVGVDGTDKEINAADYGAAPPGEDFLIVGHESFGRVEAVGPNVTELNKARNRRVQFIITEQDPAAAAPLPALGAPALGSGAAPKR